MSIDNDRGTPNEILDNRKIDTVSLQVLRALLL